MATMSTPLACRHGASDHAAFFDVDETLLSGKSMFDFLAHHLRARGEPSSAYDRLTAELRDLATDGSSRAQINRAYYRLYRGESYEALASEGMRWFEANRGRPGFFLPVSVRALHRHRAQGARTILLSGSFFACLDAIAAGLGVDEAHGTRPMVHQGRLTGEVERPMIGTAKGAAARELAVARGLCLRCSHAYGDHPSDLPLLESVGHPHVVGSDPELLTHAAERGWPVLDPRAPAPVDLHHGEDCRCGCVLADWSMRRAVR